MKSLLSSICSGQSALPNQFWESRFDKSAVSKMLWEICSERWDRRILLFNVRPTQKKGKMLWNICQSLKDWKYLYEESARRNLLCTIWSGKFALRIVFWANVSRVWEIWLEKSALTNLFSIRCSAVFALKYSRHLFLCRICSCTPAMLNLLG